MSRIVVGLAAWIAVASQAALTPGEKLQPGDLVGEYARTRERGVRALYVRSRTIQEFDDPTSPGPSVRLAQQELYLGGQSIDLRTDGFQPTAAVDDANLPVFHRRQQQLWNGTTYYYVYTGESSADSAMVIDKDPSYRAEHILAEAYMGAPLDGYFPADQEDILTILREELPADASVRKMPVGEIPCYLLEAHIKGRGRYRLWFDPKHGYNIRRAVIVKDANDLPAVLSKTPDRFGRRVGTLRFVLDNVVFKQFGDIWLAVAGQWEVTQVLDNGTAATETRHHKRLEVVVGNPAGEHAFVPRAARGMPVQLQGENSGVRYRWGDGGPQPDVGWDVVKAVDAMVAKRMTERASRSGEYPLLPFAAQVIPSETVPAAAEYRTDKDRGMRAGYCGLYCMYAALRLSGMVTGFADLLKSKYLASPSGSSLHELRRAATDHRLYAEAVGKLAVRDLTASPYALILHVKRDSGSSWYGHYVLFLGMEDGQAVVCDPPHLRRDRKSVV